MILVIGGAGYIGSHVVKELIQQQHRVVVLDNLSTGHRISVDQRAVFEYGDYTSIKDLERIFSRYSIDAVMYFVCENPEVCISQSPFVRQGNQLASIKTLLEVMLAYQITNFIFSSTTVVQERKKQIILHEQIPLFPKTANGYLNVMTEQLLDQFHSRAGMRSISLRYFNAAGVHESAEIGEDHDPEVHLIPQLLLHILHKTPLTVQTDYHTEDGTYIRDYLHVVDVAIAHVLALESLLSGRKQYEVYTLGSGVGFSVKEVIHIAE